MPFGQVRNSIGSITQTDFGYTGQRNEAYTDLMDYRSRWYDPELGRFVSPDTIIPNLSNPQSLNRYSYVLGNPIRYNDPSGHRVCGLGGSGVCEKDEELMEYAYQTVKDYGKRNDLEAIARIVDKAGKLYRTYDKMIPALSMVFLGLKESNSLTIWNARFSDPCAAIGRSHQDCDGNPVNRTFGDTGFHKSFRDTFSQPFHFWAYLATAANTEGAGPASYLSGRVVGNFANIAHEIIQPDGAGATWQDYALARAGMNIGTLVNIGVVPPGQLGNTIRDYLGIDGPGAFYVNPLIITLPLVGNR